MISAIFADKQLLSNPDVRVLEINSPSDYPLLLNPFISSIHMPDDTVSEMESIVSESEKSSERNPTNQSVQLSSEGD